jgi:hypothetical protein
MLYFLRFVFFRHIDGVMIIAAIVLIADVAAICYRKRRTKQGGGNLIFSG